MKVSSSPPSIGLPVDPRTLCEVLAWLACFSSLFKISWSFFSGIPLQDLYAKRRVRCPDTACPFFLCPAHKGNMQIRSCDFAVAEQRIQTTKSTKLPASRVVSSLFDTLHVLAGG